MVKQTQVDGAVGSESGGSQSVVDVLRQAREKVASGWTHEGVYALNFYGDPVDPDSPHACRWCMVGALKAVRQDLLVYFDAKDILNAVVGSDGVIFWNDMSGRTQEEVLAAFDKAIELAASPAQAPALSSSESTATQSDSTKEEV